MKCSPVFYANYNATEDIIINQGGTDSGKTYAIIQRLIMIAVYHNSITDGSDDLVITIVGESVPNIKQGSYRIFKSVVSSNDWIYDHIENWNETDRTIYFKSGYLIEFNSYESEQKAKQGKRRYSFFNEANNIPWLVFWQIAKRTRKQVFIDYNPTAPFWAHDQLIGTGPETNALSASVRTLISDHRHNPFLSAKEHAKTEGIKDKDLWWVYARGRTGNLSGLIYPNWTMIDDSLFPNDMPFFGGLDFGYTNDETAAVKIVRIGESIYIHELCYTPGLPVKQLIDIFYSNGFTQNTPIYCDHDPEMITRLRREKKPLLALPSRKGQGSIKAGIEMIKEFKIFYTASSKNLHEERKRYVWIKDPKDGSNTNVPIGTYDHLLAAVRYGIYTSFYRDGK